MGKRVAPKEPAGELAIRTLAMPTNTNPDGDIFDGWVVSHMMKKGVRSLLQKPEARLLTNK